MASRDYSVPDGCGSRFEDYWLCRCAIWVRVAVDRCPNCGVRLEGGLYGEEGLDFTSDEPPWHEDGNDAWIV